MLTALARLRAKRDDLEQENGFTLIELLVVVVILGILIAIAIPLYLNYRKGANDAAAKSDLRNAINVLEQCNTDNTTYPTALTAVSTGTPAVITSYTPCANQKINVSSGTTIPTYTPTGTPTVTSYVIVSTNSAGSTKSYCYNSANGGPVQTFATLVTTC